LAEKFESKYITYLLTSGLSRRNNSRKLCQLRLYSIWSAHHG